MCPWKLLFIPSSVFLACCVLLGSGPLGVLVILWPFKHVTISCSANNNTHLIENTRPNWAWRVCQGAQGASAFWKLWWQILFLEVPGIPWLLPFYYSQPFSEHTGAGPKSTSPSPNSSCSYRIPPLYQVVFTGSGPGHEQLEEASLSSAGSPFTLHLQRGLQGAHSGGKPLKHGQWSDLRFVFYDHLKNDIMLYVRSLVFLVGCVCACVCPHG